MQLPTKRFFFCFFTEEFLQSIINVDLVISCNVALIDAL